MYEKFKCIELLVIELQKDGLQIPVKKFFWQMIVSDARAFQSTLKMQITEHSWSVSMYRTSTYILACATGLDLY